MSAADDRLQRELRTVIEHWRERARRFMNDARVRTGEPRDVIQFTAMSSTLEWAASDLELALRIEAERRAREAQVIEAQRRQEVER